MKDQKTRAKFVELRAQGLSFAKIAEELKVSKQTLINWSKQLQRKISNLKSIELEALQEKYYLTKRTRIELFGQKLQAVLDELAKRNLSDVPTPKLLDLMERYARILNEEAVPVEFARKKDPDSFLQNTDEDVETWQG